MRTLLRTLVSWIMKCGGIAEILPNQGGEFSNRFFENPDKSPTSLATRLIDTVFTRYTPKQVNQVVSAVSLLQIFRAGKDQK